MGNHEKKFIADTVHLFLALQRTKDGEKARCLRSVIKESEEEALTMLEAKCKLLGGTWRIHKTVNVRDVHKAYRWLLHKLIDCPDMASAVDSLWRTALLQRECKAERYFMFDVDTTDRGALHDLIAMMPYEWPSEDVSIHQTPGGWHIVTKPFDTREIEKHFEYVTLQRDGYVFVKQLIVGQKVGE